MGTVHETYAGVTHITMLLEASQNQIGASGLEMPSDRLLAPLCFRPLDPVSGQKGSIHHTTKGLEIKFKKGSKLSQFQREIIDHPQG